MKGRSWSEMEAEIRQQFQSAYKEKIKTMYSMFELKYQSLNDSILSVFDRIQKDQLLSTMLNDRTTSIHIHDRVKEIFSEVVQEAREIIVMRMGTQITNLKFQNQELHRQIKRLKETHNHLEQEFHTERLNFEQTKHTAHDELSKTKEENYNLRQQRQAQQKELQELKRKLEEIAEQNCELKDLLNSMKEQREELQSQNKEIQFYRTQLKMLQEEINQLKSCLGENQQKFQRKYQNKKKQFKQKIEEYKSLIIQMRNDRTKTEMTIKQLSEDNIQNDNDKRMYTLIKEHQKKITQLRSQIDREKIQIERKYEYKLKETQNYFEKVLQNKILEVQQSTASVVEKMKEEGTALEKKIAFYEDNFISEAELNEQIIKREELMMMMKRKLQEFEASHDVLIKNEQVLIEKLREMQMVAAEHKQRAYKLQETNRQLTGKYHSYQQSNNILKINEKKVKDQFQQYQKIVKKVRENNEDLRRKCLQLEEAKAQADNSLRQKQRKLKEATEELELLSKKNVKNQESMDTLTKQRDYISQSCSELKKEVSNLQHQAKQQQLTSTLTIKSFETKLAALQQDLKSKSSLMTQLQKQYQQMSSNFQEEKRKNYEIQNQLRKYELESQFYKETVSMQKGEHQTSLEEIRKAIKQKQQRIEILQEENQKSYQELRKTETKSTEKYNRIKAQNQKLKSSLILLNKIVVEKLQAIRKESRLIRQYLSTQSRIIQNDQAIFVSTFHKQLAHLSIYLQQQQQYTAKKIREQTNLEMNNNLKNANKDFQNKLTSLLEKQQQEKVNWKNQLKEKEERVQELNRELKKSHSYLKKERQSFKNIERELQIYESRNEQLKEQYDQKMKQIVSQMREEKEAIVRQYNDKRADLEDQIAQLTSKLKQLKQQIQIIQAQHEEEKIVINSQLRTVKEQEEAIQKVALQKDSELQKYQTTLGAMEEAKKNLQNQIRGYADTLNRKIQLIHELQLKENQITGENHLIKNKFERMAEQVNELKRKLAHKEEQLIECSRSKGKIESELRDIKGALNRSSKNHELRALNQLSIETLQLSQKVNEMRKVNAFLDSKTPLRS